eukprot:scaffold5017_cov171-Amphora_coffeaeformis.AAC.29
MPCRAYVVQSIAMFCHDQSGDHVLTREVFKIPVDGHAVHIFVIILGQTYPRTKFHLTCGTSHAKELKQRFLTFCTRICVIRVGYPMGPPHHQGDVMSARVGWWSMDPSRPSKILAQTTKDKRRITNKKVAAGNKHGRVPKTDRESLNVSNFNSST